MNFFKFFSILLILLSSCSTQNSGPVVPTDQNEIRNVIIAYCNASNDKEAQKIPDLLFNDLFSEEMTRKSVTEMFYKQLLSIEKFEIKNLRFEENATLLEDAGNIKVYCQKYISDISMQLPEGSPRQVFDTLEKQALASDPSAEINADDYSLSYTDKKKIIVVNQSGKYYLIPDAFFSKLDTDLFDTKKVFEAYTTA